MKIKLLLGLIILGILLVGCATSGSLLPENGNEFEFEVVGKNHVTFLEFVADDGATYSVNANNVVWVYDRTETQPEQFEGLLTTMEERNGKVVVNLFQATIYMKLDKNPEGD